MSRSCTLLVDFCDRIFLVLLTCSFTHALGFLPPVNYTAGNTPQSVAIGDFYGDGKLDLAVANYLGNSVSIFRGIGDGTFQSAKTISVGPRPLFVAAVDLNGDGRPDLVTTNFSNSTISVLLNSSRGFLPAVAYPTGGYEPSSVTAGDFDRDGKMDLVVANRCIDSSDCTSDLAAFLKGNGDGTFQLTGTYDAGKDAGVITAADFNGDNKLDLAVADYGGVSILLGNGDGSFGPATIFAAGTSPISVVQSDFNRDGKVDVAVADQLDTVNVLLGNGDGTLQPAVSYKVGHLAGYLAAGDLNGDGNPDIAARAESQGNLNTVVVLLGKGDGTFPGRRRFTSGDGTQAVAIADLNHDGASDLITPNGPSNNVSAILNAGGTFVTTTSSENPAPVGQSITFTATATPSLVSTTPTGTITFADGATILATVPLDQSGQASFTTSGLTQGTHTIRTKYSGDPNFNPNTGKAITQIMQ